MDEREWEDIVERNNRALERNERALERNERAYDRNTHAFDRNTRAFEELVNALRALNLYLAEQTAAFQRMNQEWRRRGEGGAPA